MWYIHIMEYYSAIKREWSCAICRDVDRPRDCYTEWRNSETGKQISYNIYCLCVESRKMIYRWTYFQSRNRDIDIENEYMNTGVGGSGVGWTGRLVLTHMHSWYCVFIKEITYENPLHCTRNGTMLCVDLNGKETQERVDIGIWIVDSLFWTAETNSTVKQLHSHKN